MPERTTERPGSLVESHKGYDTRILFFYPFIAVLLLVLVGGFAYQQIFRTDLYNERERQQNQRRILMPGPRGDILDREGRALVVNRARFSVTLNLDELRKEFREEDIRVRKNYRALDESEPINRAQERRIARTSVVQRYLDQVNRVLGRDAKVDADDLQKHFNEQLLIPYVLVDDLQPAEYARLVEQLPVLSPLQVYAVSTRAYPYHSAAAHTLGYVSASENIAIEDFPGESLHTFIKTKGTIGKDGLEKAFEKTLQGEAGGAIYRVDHAGYRVPKPISHRMPKQGQSLRTSIDIDLQQAAEDAIKNAEEEGEKLAGAAVAIDIATGEVLALASAPNYDLNNFTPRLSSAAAEEMTANGAWMNRAVQGLYPPGSTFKILVALAAFRSQAMTPVSTVTCKGFMLVGKHSFPCHDQAVHGDIDLPHAIAKSCNIFFMAEGIAAGPQSIADEGRRFHFGEQTKLELAYEKRGLVPSPEWKERTKHEQWFPGDTANTSIGQGYVLVTPLQMACFAASIARGETHTPPTLIHDPNRPRLRTEPIDLPQQQLNSIYEGMRLCGEIGTAARMIKMLKLGDVKIAGKTGTAQKEVHEGGVFKGHINYAWFIGYAPYDNPQIAVAVMLEGNVPGEEYGGGAMAAPIAGAIFKKWTEKKKNAATNAIAAAPTTAR